MNFGFSIANLITITSAEVIGIVDNTLLIDDIITDSRRYVPGNTTLFVALVTSANNGHAYIKDLYDRGVCIFLVSQKPEYPLDEAIYLVVKDTLLALQKVGIFHRKNYKIPVIGITGSNGKTIVKEWLFQVLNADFNIVRSPKSYNSQIGVPLSVLQLNPTADLAIFEAGISMPDEMDRLQKIILPTIGIVTNIGHAHDENFIDKRQKINEKIQLFKACDQIIYCRDHAEINERILSVETFKKKKITSWSFKNKSADLFIEINNNAERGAFKCYYNGIIFPLQLPFTDDASIENSFHVCLTALELGIKPEIIQKRIVEITSIAMRLELKAGINNCTLINDVYNSDLNSILIAIDFLAQQKQHQAKTIILSDILQSGMNENTLYSRVSEWIAKYDIQCFIGIGKALKRQQNLFNGEKYFFETTSEFLRNYPIYNFSNQSILIKGARVFEFERISTFLQQKAHQTVLEVNLTNFVSNLNYYRSLLKSGTGIMAIVKAFSYGSGSFEIANILRYHNVDYLAVAYADEGVELRNAGITIPIMVMNPDADAFDIMLLNNLEPEIYSQSILDKFITAIRNSLMPDNSQIGIHLKIDSGMHRLGFQLEDLTLLMTRLADENHIRVKSVFSHLVGSDNGEFDDFTRHQVSYFNQCYSLINKELGYDTKKHILNSAGICRFSEYHFDMVRLGIGLYGFGSCKKSEDKLMNVLSLKTIISQIKQLKQGETVGYNRKFRAEKDMISATIPIGYADGFDRRFSNGVGSVLVNGHRVPVIGNVCMDMTMIDISGLDVKEGDEVIVFNDDFTVANMAELIGTIPYEMMTSISQRVKRIYYQE